MRVLITGGHGFVGSYLTRHLRARDVDVEVSDPTVKNTSIDMSRHYQYFRCPQLAGYQAVIHLAAHSSVAACEADPQGAVNNNLLDMIHLARKMKDDQIFIFASSGSVLDRNTSKLYDATKRAGEQILPYVYPRAHILRFGTVCGVSPVMRHDLILNGMVRDAVKTGTITVRNPHAWRPVLFLPDLCAAVDRILKGEAPPGVYDMASFQSRIGGWADMVAQITKAQIVDEGPTPHYDFRMNIPPHGMTTPEEVIGDLVQYWKKRA
jgi:UDP-glucose 4-epimerase